MNDADFASSIRALWRYASIAAVGEVYACPTSLIVSDEFKQAAHDKQISYEELYLCGLRHSDYNILLFDYSYLQFSRNGTDGFRYAYYPNPFLGTSSEAVRVLSELRVLVEEGDMELEIYLQHVSEIRFSQHPPLLRYENAPSQYVELRHPCSHMHFGHHADNRWPIRRVLTPEAFGLLVMKYFYSENWESCPLIRINAEDLSLDDAFINARVNCRILGEGHFSKKELDQFHHFWELY